MSAYVIADLRITNTEQFERYKVLSTAAVEAHSGEFIVRGGRIQAVEGDWTPERVTVIKFPSWEAALQFIRSDGYTQAHDARQGAASGGMIVVEGIRAPKSFTGIRCRLFE